MHALVRQIRLVPLPDADVGDRHKGPGNVPGQHADPRRGGDHAPGDCCICLGLAVSARLVNTINWGHTASGTHGVRVAPGGGLLMAGRVYLSATRSVVLMLLSTVRPLMVSSVADAAVAHVSTPRSANGDPGPLLSDHDIDMPYFCLANARFTLNTSITWNQLQSDGLSTVTVPATCRTGRRRWPR